MRPSRPQGRTRQGVVTLGGLYTAAERIQSAEQENRGRGRGGGLGVVPWRGGRAGQVCYLPT